jgi:hypothetical protein
MEEYCTKLSVGVRAVVAYHSQTPIRMENLKFTQVTDTHISHRTTRGLTTTMAEAFSVIGPET